MDINSLCPHCLRPVKNKDSVNFCEHCGKNMKEFTDVQHQLPPMSILAGKYLIGDVLGEGGFGITYIGFDINLEMRVAVKEFYPNGYATREARTTTRITVYNGPAKDTVEKWKASFIKEARSLGKLSNLSGVVGVKDFFTENETAYIILEFLEGKTLKEFAKEQGGRLDADGLFGSIEPVMVALGEVHKAGLIHRDISPDNIMVLPDGKMKLLDFGAARDYTESGEKSLSVMLKPGYAPEEQYRSKGKQGPYSDIYALAGTIYKCITGQTPPESMERIRQDTLQRPSALGVRIDPQKENALMKALAVYSDQRYQTMGEFYRDLYAGGVPNARLIGAAGQAPVQTAGSFPSGAPSSGNTAYSQGNTMGTTGAGAPPAEKQRSKLPLIIGICAGAAVAVVAIVAVLLLNRNQGGGMREAAAAAGGGGGGEDYTYTEPEPEKPSGSGDDLETLLQQAAEQTTENDPLAGLETEPEPEPVSEVEEEPDFVSGQENDGSNKVPQTYYIDSRTPEDYGANLEEDCYAFYDGESRFSYFYPLYLYNHVYCNVSPELPVDYGTNMQYEYFTGSAGSSALYQLIQRPDNRGVDEVTREVQRMEEAKYPGYYWDDAYFIEEGERKGEGVVRLESIDQYGNLIFVMVGITDLYIFRAEFVAADYDHLSPADQKEQIFVLSAMDRMCVFSDYYGNPWLDYDEYLANSYQ